MKKIILLFILFSGNILAQQNTNYNMYMLNDYGLNPAVAGSSKNLTVLAGRRAQWGGIKYAPETNFASITKDFGRKKGINYYWHGVGIYVEQDRSGLFSSFIVHASYAIHLKLNKDYNFSFGLAGGIKQASFSTTSVDKNDPVIASKAFQVTIPDFVPGVYLYSKRVIAGISVKNIYKNTLEHKSKIIGTTGSKLYPNFYLTFARKITANNYDFIYVPSAQVQTTFTQIPSINLNFMAFYRKRVGLGVGYRTQDAVTATIQYRIHSNIVFGFSYEFTTSRLRQAKGTNSTEVMFGFHSIMNSENYERQMGGATSCPKFEL